MIADYSKVAKRQWDITPSATPGSTVLSLTNGGPTYTPTNPKVGHYTSGNVWEELAATYSANTWTTTTTSFSPFGVGDQGGFKAVLPVTLMRFTARQTASGHLLSWTTTDEVNNKGFNVETSTDPTPTGRWRTLGFVAPQPLKGALRHYDFLNTVPASVTQIVYYRLRQVDFDGTEVLSKVVSLSSDKSGKLTLYPNPVAQVLNISGDTNGTFQIMDLLGRTVMRSVLTPANRCLNFTQRAVFFQHGHTPSNVCEGVR